eukprot:CAMPEP_0169231280 /NCGR_PEP_ID=MMETSP1016-20121227/26411_1 /TAXON_ID=342587 /ORGANISM="Karlodinium micrum, Strain CCMP2283" /LENGTH=307 /DNA_ID=CAMNT_0009310371 /DNA_START=31 /DNA_END=954 /DNA_ORIENTATION=-
MSHCWGGRGVIAPESERVLIGLAEHGPWALTHAPPALREDRNFILQAVAINGESLMFVADKFRCDREVALVAIQQSGNALRLVQPPLSEDREFLLESISLSPKSALHVPAALRNDFDFMLDAIQRGAPLKYASSTLQANLRLQVAEEAVKRGELLGTMSSASSTRDFKLRGEALQEAEAEINIGEVKGHIPVLQKALESKLAELKTVSNKKETMENHTEVEMAQKIAEIAEEQRAIEEQVRKAAALQVKAAEEKLAEFKADAEKKVAEYKAAVEAANKAAEIAEERRVIEEQARRAAESKLQMKEAA